VALVDQALSTKPLTAEIDAVTHALNREVVPVLRRVRAVLNERGSVAATVVGDGLNTLFVVTHPYSTLNVMAAVVDNVTGEDVFPPNVVVARDDESTLSVTFLVAPAVDGATVLVRS
jgi:phosphohistidine swiveling domain-containing protein